MIAEPVIQVIQVKDLRKHYGAVRAVDGIGFTVARGATCALLGGNGAVLNLDGLYFSAGVITDRMQIAGSIDLSGSGDLLKWDASTVYLLRPFGFFTEDYGIGIDGLRYTSPDDAAQALTGDKNTDGWTYWQIAQDSDTLADLLDGINT